MTALYRHVAAELRRDIEQGTYRPGSMMPSLDEIGARFRVGKATASAAMKVLEADDLVRTYQGRGTVVADRRPVVVPLSRYASVMEPGGRLGPWQTACREAGVAGDMVMLDVGEQPAPGDVATALGIAPGAPVVRRDRHATIDGEAVQLHTAWYSAELVAGTALAGRERVEGGIYGALTAAGHRPVTADETVSVRSSTPEEAAELHLRDGAPVLVIERITRGADQRPLEFLHVVANPRRTTLMYDGLPLAT